MITLLFVFTRKVIGTLYYFIASFFTIVRDEKKINCFFTFRICLLDNSSLNNRQRFLLMSTKCGNCRPPYTKQRMNFVANKNLIFLLHVTKRLLISIKQPSAFCLEFFNSD